MNEINTLNRFITSIIKDPLQIVRTLSSRQYFNWISDKTYLKMLYFSYFKKRINLNNPKTYNEKLQWLKLYDRNPLYIMLVDKLEVRKYVEDKIGKNYLIPLVGSWEKVEQIEWNTLPNQFVLKTTHDSGGVVVCPDKGKLEIRKAKEKLEKSYKRNYYYSAREWPYKTVKPRIVAEKFMVEPSGDTIKDYKFFCFEGEPKVMFVGSDRGTDTRFDFYDMEFNHLPIKQHYLNSDKEIKKPDNFEKMIELSKKLSKGIHHVRVDFYDLNGKIYFGELTLYHFGGFEKFEPTEFDELMGEWIDLSKVIAK